MGYAYAARMDEYMRSRALCCVLLYCRIVNVESRSNSQSQIETPLYIFEIQLHSAVAEAANRP
jgi:hypothetical protein